MSEGSVTLRRKAAATPEELGRQVPTLLLVLPLLAMVAVLLLVPLAALVAKSLGRNNVLVLELFNGELLRKTVWTLGNYGRLVSEPYYLKALGETLLIALGGVFFSAVVGTPVAYVLSKHSSKLMEAARIIIILPLFVPDIVICYSLLGFLSRYGLLNAALAQMGLHAELTY